MYIYMYNVDHKRCAYHVHPQSRYIYINRCIYVYIYLHKVDHKKRIHNVHP